LVILLYILIMNAIFNINKPTGMTSHDVVAKIRKLLKQKRVQVTGVLTQGNLPATRFRFRYQTPNRESIVRFGGLLGRVHIGNRPLTQDREVSIGKAVYRSIDGKHWVHASRFSAPTPFDAMTLNGASANCCEVLSAGSGVTVRYSGTRTAQGRHVYVINFRLVSSGAVVTTTVLESASSGLPLSFTSTSNPPTAVSRASFDYTSPFSVAQPR